MWDELKTTLRLAPELHGKVREEMHRRQMRSVQQAVEQALETWMASDPPSAKPTPSDMTADERREVQRFLSLLREGSADHVRVVRFVIDEHTRSQREKKRSSA